MSSASIDIRFDGRKVRYEPGDMLSGEFVIRDVRRDEIRAVELSVLWYTDGKGDQDLHVHHFRRWSSEQGDWIDPRRPVRFETELPASPLSYDGLIVRVQWCVRVRLFLTDGRDELVEVPFRLGGVARARVKVR